MAYQLLDAPCPISIPASTFEHADLSYANGRASGSMNSASSAETVAGRRALTRAAICALAKDAGFSEAGIVSLPYREQSRDSGRFSEWIEAGRAGSMAYLSRTDEQGRLVRSRADVPFPWARSAIVCMASYHSAQPRSTDATENGAGWIARYAWSSRVDADGTRRPSDYHKVLLKRLKRLESQMSEQYGAFESRVYVDTGPVVERALAQAAGMGWTAKNTCLIHPKLGSYVFLGVLLTSLAYEEEPLTITVPDRCGTCRRCIEACPTDALFVPYQMDATRCISYLTIEHRGAIDAEMMDGMGRQIFGCDICQDVCPWNRKAPVSADPELQARSELVNPALAALAELDEREFEQRFNGSPVRRARFDGMRRNIAIAMGNSGDSEFAARLRGWAAAADEGLRSAAHWALKKIEKQ